MKNIVRSILFVLVFTTLATPAPAQPAAGPDAIVKSLYDATMKDAAEDVFGPNNKKRQLLTKSLDTLWKRADKKANPKGEDVGAIEFDVVSMSQDPNIKTYSVKTETRDEQRATVAATFTIGDNNVRSGQKEIVRYDFVRENGAWKIDNVRSTIDKKPWTLRENLEISLKN